MDLLYQTIRRGTHLHQQGTNDVVSNRVIVNDVVINRHDCYDELSELLERFLLRMFSFWIVFFSVCFLCSFILLVIQPNPQRNLPTLPYPTLPFHCNRHRVSPIK